MVIRVLSSSLCVFSFVSFDFVSFSLALLHSHLQTQHVDGSVHSEHYLVGGGGDRRAGGTALAAGLRVQVSMNGFVDM